MEKIRQRVACKAVIEHGSKILFLREAATYQDGTNIGKYQLPGGRIEPGEPYRECLAREVFEETGLEVVVGNLFFADEWFPVIRGEKNHIVAMFFVCRALSGKVRVSEEHDDYQWIEPTNYTQLTLTPPEDEVIKAYLRTKK